MKKFLATIAQFFRLPVIFPMPDGITADPAGMWGLFGFLSNANAYARHSRGVTTAGTNSNLSAAEAVANVLVLAAGATGGFTLTLPSSAAIISGLGAAIPINSTFTKIVQFKNNGVGQTATLTAGDASTTVTGTATIATNTTRTFALTVTGAGTLTYENLGSMSL